MSDDLDLFGTLFEDPQTEVRNCENCNNGIKTREGLKCSFDRQKECILDGEYKYWTPLAVIVLADENYE